VTLALVKKAKTLFKATIRQRTDTAWFSCLLRQPTSKQRGLILWFLSLQRENTANATQLSVPQIPRKAQVCATKYDWTLHCVWKKYATCIFFGKYRSVIIIWNNIFSLFNSAMKHKISWNCTYHLSSDTLLHYLVKSTG